MTRDEALTITQMVASNWPGNWATKESLDAYARALEPLDADVTMKAVLRCVNELEHYPRIAVLRDYVKMEKRAADYDRAKEEAVEAQRMGTDRPASKVLLPEWVKGWILSRIEHDDYRVWPQQDTHGFSSNPMPKEDQQRYIEQASAMSMEQVFRMMGVRQ